ncbi:MAG: (Fe-S)-binding protein [Planctomycetota bacterium]|jgi:RnfABCDGE-type electron transport complex B subunit
MILANILELWESAWPAGAIMLGLGSSFALVLLIAGEKLKVAIDPKIEQIHQALPNIDCGACGFAGCGSYAKAVSAEPELIGKCAPGGAQTSEKIGSILTHHSLPSACRRQNLLGNISGHTDLYCCKRPRQRAGLQFRLPWFW